MSAEEWDDEVYPADDELGNLIRGSYIGDHVEPEDWMLSGLSEQALYNQYMGQEYESAYELQDDEAYDEFEKTHALLSEEQKRLAEYCDQNPSLRDTPEVARIQELIKEKLNANPPYGLDGSVLFEVYQLIETIIQENA